MLSAFNNHLHRTSALKQQNHALATGFIEQKCHFGYR